MYPIISLTEAREHHTASELQAIGNSLDRIARRGYGANNPRYSEETYRNARTFWSYARSLRRGK